MASPTPIRPFSAANAPFAETFLSALRGNGGDTPLTGALTSRYTEVVRFLLVLSSEIVGEHMGPQGQAVLSQNILGRAELAPSLALWCRINILGGLASLTASRDEVAAASSAIVERPVALLCALHGAIGDVVHSLPDDNKRREAHLVTLHMLVVKAKNYVAAITGKDGQFAPPITTPSEELVGLVRLLRMLLGRNEPALSAAENLVVTAQNALERSSPTQCGAAGCRSAKRSDGTALTVCSACRRAHYCGFACQRSDWKQRHQEECRTLAVPPARKSTAIAGGSGVDGGL